MEENKKARIVGARATYWRAAYLVHRSHSSLDGWQLVETSQLERIMHCSQSVCLQLVLELVLY